MYNPYSELDQLFNNPFRVNKKIVLFLHEFMCVIFFKKNKQVSIGQWIN